MRKEWSTLWSNKIYLATFILLLIAVLITFKLISLFLVFNENRSGGLVLNDWVLNALNPADVSTPLFTITWICIFCCLPLAIRTPRKAMVVFISIIIISLLRSFSLYTLPLTPPAGIIPLRDTFLEGSFYNNQVLLKDLFFSGHTANLALVTFLVDLKWVKSILVICTFIVAFLLLKQHVHYTLDVMVAPFAAFLAYRLAKATELIIYNKISSVERINQNAVEVA